MDVCRITQNSPQQSASASPPLNSASANRAVSLRVVGSFVMSVYRARLTAAMSSRTAGIVVMACALKDMAPCPIVCLRCGMCINGYESWIRIVGVGWVFPEEVDFGLQHLCSVVYEFG